nr:putative lineage-restricted protein [Crepidula fornicata]
MEGTMYSMLLVFSLTLFTYGTAGSDPGAASGGTCPQALLCMKSIATIGQDPCKAMQTVVACLAKLNTTCKLKEDAITFKKLQTFYARYCEIMSGVPHNQIAQCSDLESCVKNSAQAKFFEEFGVQSPTADQREAMTTTLLDASKWCMNAESGATCFVANADSCKFDAGKIKALAQLNSEMRDTCGISSLSTTTQISSLLLLVMAIVTFFTR